MDQERWLKLIKPLLVGRTIRDVRYTSLGEMADRMWDNSGIVFVLDDGVELHVSQDDEGNGPGSVLTNLKKLPIIPVI